MRTPEQLGLSGVWWKAIEEWDMDNQTKHEIWVLTLSTLATVPVMAGLGFAVVSGIVGF